MDILLFSALAALLPIPKNQLDIAALFVLMCLLLLSAAAFLSYRKYKRIKTYANDTNNLNALYKTFLDAENNLIYLKDQNLKYVFVNKAFEYFFEIESRDIAGRDDSALQKKEFADRVMKDDREVLSSSTTVVKDYGYGGRVYRSIKFPVKLKNGGTGVGAQIMDVTSEAASMKQQMICYQTLISIGDGVIVVDRDGRIEMMNKAAEKITGWPYAEAAKKPYRDVFNFFSEGEKGPDDAVSYLLEESGAGELKISGRLLSKDGRTRYIEYYAAPIMDDMDKKIAVVLVFRDVTEEKEHNDRLRYLSTHDSLTGLYNRRFFEESLKANDTKANLPISIIVGDVNGLKLTNDIFGHYQGDLLLLASADVFQKACDKTDVIARWGGDEFVAMLPNTPYDEAQEIIARIKKEFSVKQLRAVKSSISMGCATKTSPDESIERILEQAEDAMYSNKALEHGYIRNAAISEIIEMLHQNSAREKEHSLRVSELCARMGKRLGLPEDEIRKLREAGYLHDIGKIVLGPDLINKNHLLTSREWNEVKRHTIVGYRILNSFDSTVDLTESVLTHHERWDGTGYPKSLKGEEIPRTARIISIVEGYDRMTHDSDNIRAKTKQKAIEILRENAGTMFDPELVEIFIDMIEKDDSI